MQSLRSFSARGGCLWGVATCAVILCLQSGKPANAQCFPSEPVSGFSQEAIDGEVTGSARLNGELIEICSFSIGYGGTADSLFAVVQDTSNEFELSVDVESIDGPGQAGVEVRIFRGTGSDPAQAVVRISVQEDAAGIGYVATSGVRPSKSALMGPQGTAPVPVQLPVRIGVERRANQIKTFYIGGQTRFDHLSVTVDPDSSLDASTYRVGMVHGGRDPGPGQPTSGTARFSEPLLESQQSVRPPRLDRLVENFQATVDQPTTITLHGIGLADTQEVTVAGYATMILETTRNRVSVEVPATETPVRGDVVVRTSGGTSEIPNAFFSFGKSFIRCDCNGEGTVDLSDMIAMLNHLFLGGPPCVCDESGDCNDDDQRDLSDPISGLNFFFLGKAEPPAPYPNPGTDPSVPMCGLEDQMPTITGISQTEIREGDEFSITGSGFSEGTHVVIPGAKLEVLGRTPDTITLRAGWIAQGSEARLSLIEDFARKPLSPCQPRKCPPISIGPASGLSEPVELVPSGVPTLGVSNQAAGPAKIILPLDSLSFDPTQPLEVIAYLEVPSVANVTPGSRAATFQWRPEETFEESVVSLADRLRLELSGGADLPEIFILPEKESGRVVLCPTESFPPGLSFTGSISVAYRPAVGRCGPDQTHPINDEREHGWCRFRELVEPCDGLPQFEWFIPLSRVRSKSGSLSGVPHPSSRNPHEKEIMYNLEAYCHVRKHRLWNLCTLQTLADLGRTDIPEFPIGAWVTKTIWRSDDEIPVGIDKTKLYSYVYSGDGKTYYLTAIHHITKDIDRWFWYDLYPAMQVLEGAKKEFVRGVGGCGGTNVDAPAWTADTIWANYFLCTNVTPTQPVSTSGVGGVGPTVTENSAWCGNFEFATECPDELDAANLSPKNDCISGDDTCLNCHDEGGYAAVDGALIGVDFLHSLKTGPPDPFPCDGSNEPLTFESHIHPILENHCSCHGWLNYDNLTTLTPVPDPTVHYIVPADLSKSYLWRKINNTHLAVPGGDGCAMPYDCTATPTPLPAWALNSIQAWILSGAPED